jgi:hypothetical protein
VFQLFSTNNEIYKRNLDAFKKKYPGYFQDADDATKLSDITAETVRAKDGSYTVILHKTGKSTYLHSRYRPVKEAQEWVKGMDTAGKSLFLIFGCGLGYHIREILNKAGEKARVIVYEPCIEVIKSVLEKADHIDILLNERVILINKLEETRLSKALSYHIEWHDTDKLLVSGIPSYRKLFEEEYLIFLRAVRNAVYDAILDINTSLFFAESWQTNLLKNIPYFFKSVPVKNFFGIFKGIPAVIVSAGPSLNKNVELLNRIKNRAVIICVDTALKVLLKKNIKPHMVVTIDGSVINYQKYKDIYYGDVPLAYTPSAYHEILSHHDGKKILFYTADYYAAILTSKFGMDTGWLDSGGSVANNAFDLAVKMEADPIIFIGQDLAFTDKKTHASGTMYDGRNDMKVSDQHIEVDDIFGNKVLTNYSFDMFRRWFENKIAGIQPERVYIDASEGGVKIKGTKVMNFSEAIDKYCGAEFEIEKKINDILNKNVFTREHIKEVSVVLKDTQTQLKNISEIADKCFDLSSELYNIYDKKIFDNDKIASIKLELDEKDKEITEKRENIALVNYVLTPAIHNAIKLATILDENESEEEKGMRIARTSQILYKGLKDAIKYTEPLLEECLEKLRGMLL